jgi:hypothetical protein
MRRKLLLTWLALGGALVACSDNEPIAPARRVVAEGPTLVVLDATNGGSLAFRWLPPFSLATDHSGTLNAGANPTITVCNWLPVGCQVVATSGSPGFPAPWVASGKKGAADYFTTSWNTTKVGLDPAKDYKLFVLVGGVIQGYADLKVVSSSNDLGNVPSGFVGVVAGSALEIPFRIRRGLTRTWKGGFVEKGKSAKASTATDWAVAQNWTPEGAPFMLDTLVVVPSANQPALTDQSTVHSVDVRDGASLSLGTFNLSLLGSVKAAASGKIVSTTGYLRLSGEGTVAGTIPGTFVVGKYTVSGNVTSPQYLDVSTGSLTNSGWLITVSR